jgi:putative membrane-bound dehydrogenase-like protein
MRRAEGEVSWESVPECVSTSGPAMRVPLLFRSLILIGWIAVGSGGVADDATPLRAAQNSGNRRGDLDANRLTYLDEFCDPYYAGRDFPKLITPQWVGEEGVEAVVTLGIDDMRDTAKYEFYLRPILERLKKIDGRAAVSIMTCSVDPADPQLQAWLAEGVSIETHTADHPCPCLIDGDFAKAKDTYDRCVDQMASIPNNRPVAFRFPCCDSLNTPSPRAFAEIINRTTPNGNFLQLSSSVCVLLTADDPDLPRSLVLGSDGQPRFARYVPFPSFVNKVRDYPYPFVVGRLCWEFPIAVPDDWQAQNLQKPNNPQSVEDLQAMIDATVIKQGTANIVFHPHGWIRNDQMIRVIDHVVQRHGRQVKFLTFRECIDRLNKHLLAGQPLRDEDGADNGVRLLDLNNDGFLDVVIANDRLRRTRLWSPSTGQWIDGSFPVPIAYARQGRRVDAGVRFGIVRDDGHASFVVRNEDFAGVWHFDGTDWQSDDTMFNGLKVDGAPVFTSREGLDQGVRLRDLDGDGRCEMVVGGVQQRGVLAWEVASATWQRLPFGLPEDTAIVDTHGRDAGLRFVDVDEDGRDDVFFSNERTYGLHLYDSRRRGWSRKIRTGKRGDVGSIPVIARSGTNNGAWCAARHLWIQNEDTFRMPDGVDRRSFAQLLGSGPARPRSAEASLQSMEVQEGFRVELVAAEPLVMDPVAIDWGPDGRLWVAEMADYPLGIDGHSRPGGRVRVLEDTSGNGTYDKSTLFLDQLSTPTGVMAWRDGVLITAAPDVLYAEDTDGDGRADRREVLFHGFGEGNQQHRVNGLRYGLDNWVHLSNGDSGGRVESIQTGAVVDIGHRDLRIRPDEGLIDLVFPKSQFGRSRDDWGNWFGCNNPNPIFHFVLADHDLRRNPYLAPPAVSRDILEGSKLVFPISPVISHCDTKYRPVGAPTIFTSACSTIVYRDDLFGPAYRNCTFTSEPVYNIVHRRALVSEGVTFRSVRPAGRAATEFLRSSDSWFRPTTLRTGPDGALYFADMYREVIEHPEWIDDELEERLDLRAGHDCGRIYRIVPIGQSRRAFPRLDRRDTAGLVAALESPNGWQRDMVQRMLIWRADESAIPLLEELASSGQRPVARLHALCTLDGMGALRQEVVAAGLADPHAGVRRHALRLAGKFLESGVAPSSVLADRVMASGSDSDLMVQLQLALTLGSWDDAMAAGLLAELALRHANDPYLSAAVLSSVNERNVQQVLGSVTSSGDHTAVSRNAVAQLVKMAAALGKYDSAFDLFASHCQPDQDRFAAWQLVVLSELLDVLATQERGRLVLREHDAARAHATRMFAHARGVASDVSATEPDRLATIRLLKHDFDTHPATIRQLVALVVPTNSIAIQSAAVSALVDADGHCAVHPLLDGWQTHSPQLRAEIFDALAIRPDGARTLAGRLQQGKIPAAHVSANQRQTLLSHADDAVRAAAKRVFAGTIDPDRERVLAAYRREQHAGDVTRGKQAFAKHCAACHQLDGAGHHVGPDLATLTNRTADAIYVAVLDPNRAVEDKYLQYNIVTTDGRLLSGIVSEESGNSVALIAADGQRHSVLRNQIEEFRSSGKSLMPEGVEKLMTPQELADVVTYVQRGRSAASSTAP